MEAFLLAHVKVRQSGLTEIDVANLAESILEVEYKHSTDTWKELAAFAVLKASTPNLGDRIETESETAGTDLSPRLKEVLDDCVEQANKLGTNRICSEDILLSALAKDKQSICRLFVLPTEELEFTLKNLLHAH